MEIRIDSNVEVYVSNPLVGDFEISNKSVLVDKCEDGRIDCNIEFYDARGIGYSMDISLPIIEAEDHLNYQLSIAKKLSQNTGHNSDRYTIKEMWLKKVYILGDRVKLEFWWKDVFNDTRCYVGREYKIRKNVSDYTKLFVFDAYPQFYF